MNFFRGVPCFRGISFLRFTEIFFSFGLNATEARNARNYRSVELQEVEECDATEADGSTAAGNKNKM
jgi:hypothetical protein